MSVIAWAAVAVLGALASVTRFRLDIAISGLTGATFPYGTLAVNLSGSLCLGLLDGAGVTGTAATLLGTATIGSFTTFSTWMLESQRLRESSAFLAASLNIVVTLLLGFAALLGGHALGRLL